MDVIVQLLFDALQVLIEVLFSPARARFILLTLCSAVIVGSGGWAWTLFHR